MSLRLLFAEPSLLVSLSITLFGRTSTFPFYGNDVLRCETNAGTCLHNRRQLSSWLLRQMHIPWRVLSVVNPVIPRHSSRAAFKSKGRKTSGGRSWRMIFLNLALCGAISVDLNMQSLRTSARMPSQLKLRRAYRGYTLLLIIRGN